MKKHLINLCIQKFFINLIFSIDFLNLIKFFYYTQTHHIMYLFNTSSLVEFDLLYNMFIITVVINIKFCFIYN